MGISGLKDVSRIQQSFERCSPRSEGDSATRAVGYDVAEMAVDPEHISRLRLLLPPPLLCCAYGCYYSVVAAAAVAAAAAGVVVVVVAAAAAAAAAAAVVIRINWAMSDSQCWCLGGSRRRCQRYVPPFPVAHLSE